MDKFLELLSGFKKRIETLEKPKTISKVALPADGVLIIPLIAGDPASPTNGQMWVNTSSGTFKIRIGGVTKIVTIT